MIQNLATQDQINQINSNLSWKLLGTYQGASSFTINPDTLKAKEICIRVWIQEAGIYVSHIFNINEFNFVQNQYYHNIGGWYYGSNNGWALLTNTNTSFSVVGHFDGSIVTPNCVTDVWYR